MIHPQITRGFVATINVDQQNNQYHELFDLRGVPQPIKWHPEGDAFNHTVMVIDMQQTLYPDDYLLNLCTVTHDFGKAHTPKWNWPKHYGHANLGMKPSYDFTRRLGYDHNIATMVSKVTQYHMHIHDAHQMKMSTYRKIFDDFVMSAYGNIYTAVDWLYILAKLGVCDHFGRGGVDKTQRYNNPFVFFTNVTSFMGDQQDV